MSLKAMAARVRLRVFGALVLVLPCAAAGNAGAATAVTADTTDGYAAVVMTRLLDVWAPPPSLKGDFRARVRLSIDGDGRLTSCTAVQKSGMEAFEASLCGAARQVKAFGPPPYAQPLDVHLTFWSGTPRGKPGVQPLDSQEAARAEARARTRAEAVQADSRAASTEEAARKRAEEIARASGAPMPEVHPAPAARSAPPRTAAQAPRAARAHASGVDSGSPATVPIGGSGRAAQPAKRPSAAPAAAASAVPAGADAGAAPARVSASAEAYRHDVRRRLRKLVRMPEGCKPGTYTAHVRLFVSPEGRVEKSQLLRSTGDEQLDKAVRSGLVRVGRLPAPPAECAGAFPLTLTLTRP